MSNKDKKKKSKEEQSTIDEPSEAKTIIAQFVTSDGQATGSQLELPVDTSSSALEAIINHLLSNEEQLPYSFYLKNGDYEIVTDLKAAIEEVQKQQQYSEEEILQITFQPQAIFRVRGVTRCTASLSGHSDSVLCVAFSPDGQRLASGSGDTTLRIWDVNTETPQFTLKGHKSWVLYVCWSPDGKKVASGGMDKEIRIWCPLTGKQIGSSLKGHKQYVTAISWEPLHKNPDCSRLVSASKDGTIKVWDLKFSKVLFSMSSHTMSVTCVKWGGEGLIYSGSQDRTIKVWDATDGKLCRSLEGHAHWVNSLALNTDSVLRTGAYDHTGKEYNDKQEAQQVAQARYDQVMQQVGGVERLVSGSDDFTMFLWEPTRNKKPIMRLTGHQQLINVVSFSPDGRLIASASFDKSIKIWNALTGKFIATLRGHVEAVYQVCWSSDSRLLVSGSRDSTVKVWDMATKKLKFDLPGHADEVFAVDWSPDGQRVASGSKDQLLKIWRH